MQAGFYWAKGWATGWSARLRLQACAVAGIALFLAGMGHAAQAQDITGAGATFPEPIYQKWAEAAKAAIGIDMAFYAIGSAGGQDQILNRSVDFGASDAPMDPAELQSGDLLQFPTVMGEVVVVVNIPRVATDRMRLTGALLAGIFSGSITMWDDPRLVALNKKLNLPNLPIEPVHRADGSGTTYVFTTYLSAVSTAWKAKFGAGTHLAWPLGLGARGNDGVAAAIRQTRGGIGYVEWSYALRDNLTTVRLQSAAGRFVAPGLASLEGAAENAEWRADRNFAADLIRQPGPESWPIVSATYILVPKNPAYPQRAQDVIKFFNWAYDHGGPIASRLTYLPVPAKVQNQVREAWHAEIKGLDGKPLY